MRGIKRFVAACALSGALLAAGAGGGLAKEVADPHASCVGVGFSDHASAGDFKGGAFADGVAAIKESGTPPGAVISGFASFHEGSHAACEPKFGATR